AQPRRQLREVTEFAAEHFRNRLADTEAGARARTYLWERGIGEQTLRAFGLGWAGTGWTELADKLRQAGMLEWGVAAGLVHARPNADGFYDVFRGRVMIPICASDGRNIAFGGRLVEGNIGPKYLNSKESKLYNKSEVLFGLSLAKEELRR